jgi:NADH-quinone oxidoreductase subunit A
LLTQFAQIGLLLVAIVLFIISLPIIASAMRKIGMAPKKPSPVKMATYESGMTTVGRSWVQFNFRYYTYALLFVALDVTAVMLYLWAANLKDLDVFGLVVALVFMAILTVGYIYAWKKKALEWK